MCFSEMFLSGICGCVMGTSRVEYPECGGELLFETSPEGDGIFEEHERAGYLGIAMCGDRGAAAVEAGQSY